MDEAREARLAAGRRLRKSVPRAAHAEWRAPDDRPDPIAMLEASNEGRVPDLIPERYARMSVNAFAFLRGSAGIMAHDLATATPSTGLLVQVSGDAHLENFGIFATPERRVIFDINDFDETLRAPWEWDVKRLAASIHVAGRMNDLSEKQCGRAVRAGTAAYRETMQICSDMSVLDVWYARTDATVVLQQMHEVGMRLALRAKAPDHTHEMSAEQYVVASESGIKLADKPPKLYHPPPDEEVVDAARSAFERYRASLRDDVQVLLSSYEFADAAVKVVGTGSVGTRCAVLLLVAGASDSLILQVKEARPSVLEPYAGASPYALAGQRVVAGQRLMQPASDIFLGWAASDDGHHFYVRQLSDMKGSIDVTSVDDVELSAYAQICAKTLATAHARSGDPAAMAGYMGASPSFDGAIAEFARRYADQIESDYALFKAALKDGRLTAS